jgi:hypothetical protein
VDATLTDFESPLGARKSIMTKEYSIEVPSVDSKPMSIVRAVNLAVRKLSEQIRADIAATLLKEGGTNIEPDRPNRQRSAVRVSASTYGSPDSGRRIETQPRLRPIPMHPRGGSRVNAFSWSALRQARTFVPGWASKDINVYIILRDAEESEKSCSFESPLVVFS